LNAVPLWDALHRVAPSVEVFADHPSRLADQLAAGGLDVALIPSVEYLRGARAHGYRVIPDIAIVARRAAESVKLFCRVAPERIDRLMLDEGSRTSQVLARVWLEAAYGLQPSRIESLPMGMSALETTADAVLVIGDRAMSVQADGFHTVVDLGEAWNKLTGLPFVFAFWVARGDVELGSLPASLAAAKDEGLADVSRIAREGAARLGHDADRCFDYLTRVISYDLGEPEMRGFRRFAQMGADLGLLPEGVDLVFQRGVDFAESR
jgi:chorismate dehydratase